MLSLKMNDGGMLDIPAESILFIEQNPTESKRCSIVYTLEQGKNLSDDLSMTYGALKKKWIDNTEIGKDLIEVTFPTEKKHKMAFPGHMIIARRELKDRPDGANTQLTLNVAGRLITIAVTDKRETLIGE